jgi:hypothetical protein
MVVKSMPSDWDEIDWEDVSGSIAFKEWEKRDASREKTKEDIEKVIDFTPDDWILVLLHLNGNSLKKTPIFKQLCIFGERTGINDFDVFSWYPHKYGAHSKEVEAALEKLVSKDKLELKIGTNQDDHEFKNYIIKDNEQAEYLCELLPDSIKNVLLELKEEFEGKRVAEIVDFAHDAYPEYATKAIANRSV